MAESRLWVDPRRLPRFEDGASTTTARVAPATPRQQVLRQRLRAAAHRVSVMLEVLAAEPAARREQLLLAEPLPPAPASRLPPSPLLPLRRLLSTRFGSMPSRWTPARKESCASSSSKGGRPCGG